MAIIYEYDSSRNLVFAKAEGVIKVSDIMEHINSVLQDDTIKIGFVEVITFENVKDLMVSYSQVVPFREMWHNYINKGCKATLVLATTAVHYGTLRMIQTVIGADEFKGGALFYVLRTKEELEEKIACINESTSTHNF